MRKPLFLVLALVLAAAPVAADPITRAVYPAPTAPVSAAGLPGAAVVEVRTADGLTLTGLSVPPRAGMPTLLVFHGNGSSAMDTVRWFGPASKAGYGLVAAEYRGYSANPGRPNEKGLAADADAFFALARRTAGDGPVWAVGHSLGGGVALGLSRRERLDAVFTIGTFTRLLDMAPAYARPFMGDAYDNLGAVRALDEPLHLIHGDADDVVPAAQGRALYEAAVKSKKAGAAYVLAGADHHPSSEAILAVLESVRTGSPSGLPDGMKRLPFDPAD